MADCRFDSLVTQLHLCYCSPAKCGSTFGSSKFSSCRNVSFSSCAPDEEAAMAKMQAVQIARVGGPLELVERELPEPEQGEVRIRIEACGVCHSDSLTVEGQWPGLSFPRIPGHEIAGVIEAIGADVVDWRVGQRVGVGWF